MTRHQPVFDLHTLLHHIGSESDDDDDMDSVSSILSPSPSVAETSVTSHDISMRSASPAPSVRSMSSSMREQIFRQEYGRGLNNYSDVYALPADDEEWERLEKQYSYMTSLMGKYPPPFGDIMRDEGPGGEIKRCLDLGCGNGAWIMDVANDFPHCEAVAVDLVPMQSLSMPPNLRSEVDDLNMGLEHFYGDFNVVHAWLITSGIKDYDRLIDEISHVLRPGGMIDLMEWGFDIYDGNKQSIPLSVHGPPWLAAFLGLVLSAIKKRGGDVGGPSRMATLVQNHPDFEHVVVQEFWVTTTPWMKDDPEMVRGGINMREDVFAFLKSAGPLLLGNGTPAEVYEFMKRRVTQEMIEAKYPYWTRLRRVYALKRR